MHLLRYYLQEGLLAFRSSPLPKLIAVSTIAVAMFVLSVTITLLVNIDRLSRQWGEEVRLIAFLGDDVSQKELDALAKVVGAWREVATVTPRTRRQAFDDFKASLGRQAGLLEGLGPEVMPSSLEITVTDSPSFPIVAERLRSLEGLVVVDEVVYGEDLLERVSAARDTLRIGGLVLFGLVLAAILFIIGNTIRLGLFAHRAEIEIMQLVGATPAFVRGPYYVEGALQGLLGSATAIALLYLLCHLATTQGGDLGDVQSLELARNIAAFLPTPIVGAIVLCGLLVGLVASHISVTRFLRAHAH